jgi:hypothetical protein
LYLICFRLTYKGLGWNDKNKFIETLKSFSLIESHTKIIETIVRESIDIFTNSSSFATGRNNAIEYLRPIIPLLKSEDVEYLMEGILIKQQYNDQLIDCAFIMEEVFNKTIQKFPNTLPYWKKFVEQKKKVWQNMSTLENLMEL